MQINQSYRFSINDRFGNESALASGVAQQFSNINLLVDEELINDTNTYTFSSGLISMGAVSGR